MRRRRVYRYSPAARSGKTSVIDNLSLQKEDFRHDCLKKGSTKCGIPDVSKANMQFDVYKTLLLKLRINKESNYGRSII